MPSRTSRLAYTTYGFRWLFCAMLLWALSFAPQAQTQSQDLNKTQAQADPTLSADSAANCGSQPIKMADLTWESAAFTTQLFKQILQHGYGCKVEVIPGSAAALEVALSQNDIQILAELWDGRTEIIEKAVAAGQVKVVGNTLAGGAEQGWYVPDYVVQGDPDRGIEPDAPQLREVSQLKDYAAVFADAATDQAGRFYNCPAGWICETFNTSLLRANGLDTVYDNYRAGTGAALDAAISSAYERGQPILFYYWQPSGLPAKYGFQRIEQPLFQESCWEAALENSDQVCPTDFLVSNLSVAVSAQFADSQPELIQFFERYVLEPEQLNAIILRMTDEKLSGQQLALEFLEQHPEQWQQWVPASVAKTLSASLGLTSASPDQESAHASSENASTETASTEHNERQHNASAATDTQASAVATDMPTSKLTRLAAQHSIFPDWSFSEAVNRHLQNLVRRTGESFRAVSNVILRSVLLPLERGLTATPAWLVLLLVGALGWHATRRISLALVFVVALYGIGALGLWAKLMQTLALVLVATASSIVIGAPLGILAARSRYLNRVLMGILDVMQTMPSFVYLIPVLMLFGLGKVPALFATIIYAMPPLIRLTNLGIRQVDPQLTEAAQSFGVTRWQMLRRVTLPLARPSIMAGINQTTMMALSMVVVASMIGAQGLGEDVLAGIQTLDIGRGLQAGVAIVVLAIVMDRITQAYGQSRRVRRQYAKGGNSHE